MHLKEQLESISEHEDHLTLTCRKDSMMTYFIRVQVPSGSFRFIQGTQGNSRELKGTQRNSTKGIESMYEFQL